MKHLSKLVLISICAASSTAVLAQTYTGPSSSATASSASHYTGPSIAPKLTIKQLLAEGRDDQYVTLVGKIIRHTGGEDYVLADGTGEIKAEIASKYFPKNQSVSETTQVELKGKFDKSHFGTSELEVKEPMTISK
jgi:uncharacterized protein (TIGR00156 family)